MDQVRQAFTLLCNSTVLVLAYNYMKSLTVTKIVKKNTFEGFWSKLKRRKDVSRGHYARNLLH